MSRELDYGITDTWMIWLGALHGSSDYACSEMFMSLRTTVVAQSALISELQSADHRRQRVISELLASDHKDRFSLTKTLRLQKGLQHRRASIRAAWTR
ncbi:hypothetical protein Tco_0965556 [Tanacetum coccineum]